MAIYALNISLLMHRLSLNFPLYTLALQTILGPCTQLLSHLSRSMLNTTGLIKLRTNDDITPLYLPASLRHRFVRLLARVGSSCGLVPGGLRRALGDGTGRRLQGLEQVVSVTAGHPARLQVSAGRPAPPAPPAPTPWCRRRCRHQAGQMVTWGQGRSAGQVNSAAHAEVRDGEPIAQAVGCGASYLRVHWWSSEQADQ